MCLKKKSPWEKEKDRERARERDRQGNRAFVYQYACAETLATTLCGLHSSGMDDEDMVRWYKEMQRPQVKGQSTLLGGQPHSSHVALYHGL